MDPKARTALGFDPATTTKGTSNPSVLAVAEDHPPEVTIRALFIWKTRDLDIARERLRAIAEDITRCPDAHVRVLAVDATNEKYFAEDMRRQLYPLLPVYLGVASESTQPPGQEKPTNWKELLGDQYVALLHDNLLTLLPEAYVRTDHRLVMKDLGRHGDTFDAAKLPLHALTFSDGSITSMEGIYSGPNDPLHHITHRHLDRRPFGPTFARR